jgi:trimethylamine--corrinoid protein Co-methyltransferase
MSLALPMQVAPERVDILAFLQMVTNTTKPLCFTSFSLEGLKEILEMCALITKGKQSLARKPFVIHYSEPISPLMHGKEAVQKLLLCAEWKVPIVYASGLMAGASGPATLAGSLATANAEGLSGLVISQLRQEGAPFVYGGFVTIMDMSTAIFSHGAPEFHLMSAALADMAHFYRLPVWGSAGLTDSKCHDLQVAIEATSACLMAGLSGANLVHDVGYLEGGLTSSYTTPVMNDEVIGMVRRIIRGIGMDEESLAVELIGQVGPGRDFIGEDHTLRHFRDEFWFPKVFDRNRYDKWASLGGKTLEGIIGEKAKRILKEHKPKRLTRSLLAALRARAEGRTTSA